MMTTNPYQTMTCVRCAQCGRPFHVSVRKLREGMMLCAGCMDTRSRCNTDPMVQIEQGEHSRLLRLYYAVFEHECARTPATETACRKAFDDCNRFFEGGSPCRL
ncbi:hypothetical protein [Oleidesulfovibrio alaskensis]|jgi:hypothetical protein|uniref:hypothetical protein n=1 Tax=Oleidesulfovibrio alaskensis TaxID=58180 RepID=UPI001A4855D1|nr:hypothetical protein [Oleidesulfovibrio alaskensis]MBL3582550.1 hypothetical protein [Oleidesulfovibrio alaskensis]